MKTIKACGILILTLGFLSSVIYSSKVKTKVGKKQKITINPIMKTFEDSTNLYAPKGYYISHGETIILR